MEECICLSYFLEVICRKPQVFSFGTQCPLIAPLWSQSWIYNHDFRQNAGAVFNDLKLAFVIKDTRKIWQLRDGFFIPDGSYYNCCN